MKQRFCNGMIHVIKQGDNLYQLSRKYRVPLALILRANPYVDVYNLQIGQEICIPMSRPIMPFPGMRPPMQPRTYDEGSAGEREENAREREEEMRENRGEVMMSETEGTEAVGDMQTEQQDESLADSYVCDGATSLAAILENTGMTIEELLENNNLNEIIVGADVRLTVPKKV